MKLKSMPYASAELVSQSLLQHGCRLLGRPAVMTVHVRAFMIHLGIWSSGAESVSWCKYLALVGRVVSSLMLPLWVLGKCGSCGIPMGSSLQDCGVTQGMEIGWEGRREGQ